MTKQKNSTKQDLINDIYQSANIDRPQRNYYLIIILISSVISLLGGFLGASIYHKLTYAETNGSIYTLANNKLDELIPSLSNLVKNQDNGDIKSAQENFQVLGIYKKRALGQNLGDGLILQADFLSSALVVTSDGWLMSSVKIPSLEGFVVLDSSRNQYTISQQIVDDFNGVSLLKINAQGLRPAKFIPEYLDAPTNLLVVKHTLNSLAYQAISIEQKNYWPVSQIKDLVHSTEKIDHYLKLSKSLDKSYDGGVLIDDQGQIVGLVQIATGQSLAIPNYYASATWKKFLDKSEKVIHASMGLSYLNFSESLGLADKIKVKNRTGALVYTDNPKVSAVIKDSAASLAGLQVNDLIIKVNDESIDDFNSLTKSIQQYNPGSKLDLTIIRQGQEIKKQLTLQ